MIYNTQTAQVELFDRLDTKVVKLDMTEIYKNRRNVDEPILLRIDFYNDV